MKLLDLKFPQINGFQDTVLIAMQNKSEKWEIPAEHLVPVTPPLSKYIIMGIPIGLPHSNLKMTIECFWLILYLLAKT